MKKDKMATKSIKTRPKKTERQAKARNIPQNVNANNISKKNIRKNIGMVNFSITRR